MSVPLPSYFTVHEVTVRALISSGGMGARYADPEPVHAFVQDEQKKVIGADGSEVVSNTQTHINFDEQVPLGSLVTVWAGMTGEREAAVVGIGRYQHPTLPSYQTLYLE